MAVEDIESRRMNRELREFRRLERVCLEQAALSTMDLARTGLLKVADDCRLAAEAIEAQALEAQAPLRGALAGAVQALKIALNAARPSWH
jgi:hypothetical protein